MAANAWGRQMSYVAPPARVRSAITPEIYFAKRIDNSRLVKVADARRSREMFAFGAVLCCLFVLVMMYTWQHFSAIEYGYKIEAAKAQRDALLEANRTLRLEEASLRDPGRIDMLARQMGLQSPAAGQVVHLGDAPESGGAVLASVSAVSVLSAR